MNRYGGHWRLQYGRLFESVTMARELRITFESAVRPHHPRMGSLHKKGSPRSSGRHATSRTGWKSLNLI